MDTYLPTALNVVSKCSCSNGGITSQHELFEIDGFQRDQYVLSLQKQAHNRCSATSGLNDSAQNGEFEAIHWSGNAA